MGVDNVMTDKNEITIDIDKNCTRCGDKGVTQNGLCLKCIGIAAMDSIDVLLKKDVYSADDIRRQVQDRVKEEAEKFPPKDKEESKVTSEFISQCLRENAKGDASLYAEIFRDKYLYCKGMKEWFAWAGHFWKLDIMDEAITSIEEVAVKYLEEYKTTSTKVAEMANAGADGSDLKKLQGKCTKLAERVRQLRGSNRRTQCLQFIHTIKNPLAISGEEFDKRPMLFPCANGVIDLETGKLHAGRPTDYLSMASPIEFNGIDDPPELWEKSLLEIYGCEAKDADRSMPEFIRRLFGYAITGYSHEKVFPIFWGKGGWNGRSVILETISDIMGAMAGPIPSEMLLSQKFAKSSSGPSPDVMKLKGLRLAIATETDENQRFSTSKIKWYTGNNELTGRWPNDKRPIDFRPTHTLILESNYQPAAPANDRSFWERVHLIPHKISYVNRDPRELFERRANLNLRKEMEKEKSKILGWMVKGCLLWQKDGLKPPDTVTEATKKYREDEDMIGDFTDECCIKEPGAKEKGAYLYNRFVEWYHANIGKNEPSGTWFGKQLSQKYEKNKSTGCVMYHGLKLADGVERV
jgi:putative DNA primase/helicase